MKHTRTECSTPVYVVWSVYCGLAKYNLSHHIYAYYVAAHFRSLINGSILLFGLIDVSYVGRNGLSILAVTLIAMRRIVWHIRFLGVYFLFGCFM
jgi:hypothetical protein